MFFISCVDSYLLERWCIKCRDLLGIYFMVQQDTVLPLSIHHVYYSRKLAKSEIYCLLCSTVSFLSHLFLIFHFFFFFLLKKIHFSKCALSHVFQIASYFVWMKVLTINTSFSPELFIKGILC